VATVQLWRPAGRWITGRDRWQLCSQGGVCRAVTESRRPAVPRGTSPVKAPTGPTARSGPAGETKDCSCLGFAGESFEP
jgi:hypothetical protein